MITSTLNVHFHKGMRIITVGLLALVTLVGLPKATSAQSQNDGSIYSRFGLGERISFYSSKSQAMGGGGYALSSSQYANFANPASLSDQFLTRFAGGFTYQSINAQADGQPQGTLASGTLSGVSLSFPLRANRTGMGLSLTPYTSVSYRVDTESSVVSDPEGGVSIPLITSFKGNGGLYRFSTGIGHRLTDALTVGASSELIFGILEENQQTLFNDLSFVDRSVSKATRMHGLTAKAGFKFVVPGMPDGKGLVIGGTIRLPKMMTATRSQALVDKLDRDTLGTVIKGDIKLPLELGFGVAFQPDPRWTLIADVSFEGWSEFESDFDLPGYSTTGPSNVSNGTRISAGAEYWPAARRPFAPWSSKIAYRIGFYTDQSYISPNVDENIGSIGITGGLSLPSLVPGTTIDMNIDVGRRGTTSNGLVRDRYIRFGLNINFGERWFERLPLG
ncbi:MAG: hypothetical protein HOC28_09500 [Bacteroidetes Order II. Incertae sedis bacterium]|nr:hypothetical protein [Bacteroidetes Order II. bacterium]MBT4051954.1 hypothetical protein [Bacteroidetes Order II. bacterium]MBT4603360.1 hypothetical protein [Bacteroidetes Order II. bacterium]MBT5249641.1 hypothetical protein [Bacteroidetes Order II. bacterium]MBT6424296.1 hypothetical protein [Bacteroidetes Order II. bacterium]